MSPPERRRAQPERPQPELEASPQQSGLLRQREAEAGAAMTLGERCDLVLAAARALFVNGQATEQTVAAAERLGRALGMGAELMPRWGELELKGKDNDAEQYARAAADPTGVDMDRVASTMQAIADIESGRLSPEDARQKIDAIAKAPPAPTWLFALAAAIGALALAIIFGIQHWPSAVLIFVSAGAGGLLRRAI